MLVDLTVIKEEEDRIIEFIQTEESLKECRDPDKMYLFLPSDPKNHIEKGIYRMWNLHVSLFKETSSNFGYKNEYWTPDDSIESILAYEGPNPYGVADNIEQIKEYFKEEIRDPNNKYFITIDYIFQEPENAGKGGGWRWHKWGPYIGNLDTKCEYLDDEEFGPDFPGYVLIFHCYKLS